MQAAQEHRLKSGPGQVLRVVTWHTRGKEAVRTMHHRLGFVSLNTPPPRTDFPGRHFVPHDAVEVAVLDIGRQEPHGQRVDAEHVDPRNRCKISLGPAFPHAIDRTDACDNRVHLGEHKTKACEQVRQLYGILWR